MASSGPPENTHRHLADTIDMSRRGAAIVKQLLVLTRQPVGEGRVVFDFLKVVADVCQVCRSTFDPKMTIRHLQAESVPPVCGHPEQIEQVVLNLCLNARDAMTDSRHPSPSLTIEVDVQTVRGDAAGNTSRSGYLVRARLTDQGVVKATGLGLYTAYGIAGQHGGWIDCESKPGEGSTFSVFLPVSVEESAQSARPPVEQPPPRTTRPVTETILLVENEDTVRRSITLMLRRVVYKVLESSNGKEGLEVLDREPSAIDLILLDLSMAMVSGEDVLEEL